MKKYFYAMDVPAESKLMSTEWAMLRHSGDWRGYKTLAENGEIPSSEFILGMVNHYGKSVEGFKEIDPVNEGLLLGTSVWGKEYVRRLTDFVLPSLLEDENIAALKNARTNLLIHTNEEGRDYICSHPVIVALLEQKIKIDIMMLDDRLLELMSQREDHKYWHMGMTQSIDLQYAKALNIDYHLMIPDMMYSAGYFKRLLDLKQPIVAHSSVSANQEKMAEDLIPYRDECKLSVPPDKLMALGLRNLHDRYSCYFLDKSGFPKIHVLIMEGENRLHTFAAHMTIGFVSKYRIAKLTDRYFFTLDSELEKLFGDQEIYTPNAEDALVTVELSGEMQVNPLRRVGSLEAYMGNLKAAIPQQPLQKLFSQEIVMPLDRELLGNRAYMTDQEIEDIRAGIRGYLKHDA